MKFCVYAIQSAHDALGEVCGIAVNLERAVLIALSVYGVYPSFTKCNEYDNHTWKYNKDENGFYRFCITELDQNVILSEPEDKVYTHYTFLNQKLVKYYSRFKCEIPRKELTYEQFMKEKSSPSPVYDSEIKHDHKFSLETKMLDRFDFTRVGSDSESSSDSSSENNKEQTDLSK